MALQGAKPHVARSKNKAGILGWGDYSTLLPRLGYAYACALSSSEESSEELKRGIHAHPHRGGGVGVGGEDPWGLGRKHAQDPKTGL